MSSRVLFVALFLHLSVSVLAQAPFQEKNRPQYHFTSNKNWINDPNGLLYYNGEYHLFFQHNPFGNKWGHMSWGHAVSKDLVRWKELDIAIAEEKTFSIFSGSAVMDPFFTSGFGKERGKVPMVAIYTADVPYTNQSQHLAYSLDSGRTFTKFAGNPVLDIDKKDFRDPKVFWHAPSQKWIMSVMLPHEKKVQFYNSKSLKAWTPLSTFGPAGDTSGIWECPDLIRVPVDGMPGKYKWVFMMSPSPYMQYFVGEFDGTRFHNESDVAKIFRPDYGPDYYAAITFNNLPIHNEPVSIGWANNWNYAADIPTGEWRGGMSLPRRLRVKKIGADWILLQKPVEEIYSLQKGVVHYGSDKIITTSDASFVADWEWKNNESQELILGDKDLSIRFTPATSEVVLDRSGSAGFQHEAYKKHSLFRGAIPGGAKEATRFTLFVDESIVELYVGDGELVFTMQVFSKNPLKHLQFNKALPITIRDLGAYRQ